MAKKLNNAQRAKRALEAEKRVLHWAMHKPKRMSAIGCAMAGAFERKWRHEAGI